MQIGTLVEISFSEHGELSGTTWAGTFKVRPVLSFSGIAQADADRRRFVGNPESMGSVSEEVANIAVMLSQVKARVADAPPWFRETSYLADLIDGNVLISLFSKVMDVEKNYREALTKKTDAVLQELKPEVK